MAPPTLLLLCPLAFTASCFADDATHSDQPSKVLLARGTPPLPKSTLIKGDEKSGGRKQGVPVEDMHAWLYPQRDCKPEGKGVFIGDNVLGQYVAPDMGVPDMGGGIIRSFSLTRDLHKDEVIDFSSKAPVGDHPAPADPGPDPQQANIDGDPDNDWSDYNIIYMENAVIVNRNPGKDAKPFGAVKDTVAGSGKKLKARDQVWVDDEGKELVYSEDLEEQPEDGQGTVEQETTKLQKRTDLTGGIPECAQFRVGFGSDMVKGWQCVNLEAAANCFRMWLPT